MDSPVYRRGSGPAVIIIHEIPGLHPLVVRFADHVAAAGMTVFLPSLFGEPGRPVTVGYAVGQMIKNICIAREFNVWANDKSSPDRRLVALIGEIGPRRMRRQGRRCGRHVLHGRLRARDDDRTERGCAGSLPAVQSDPRQEQKIQDGCLARRDQMRQGSFRKGRPLDDRLALLRRQLRARRAFRFLQTRVRCRASKRSNSIPKLPIRDRGKRIRF